MLGIDVETFAVNGKGYAVPALKLFEDMPMIGDFPRRRITKNYGKGPFTSYEYVTPFGSIIEDGLAIEFPVKPENHYGRLVENLETMLLATRIAVQNTFGFALTCAPIVNFAKAYKIRPELRVFGCNPDQSIYTGNIGKPDIDPTTISWRTSGGHFHFSCGVTEMSDIQTFILLADLTLGLGDVLLDHSELAQRRRDIYGQPGKFRIQPHGVEYRTCSSVWVRTNITRLLFGELLKFLVDHWQTIDINKLLATHDVPKLLEIIQNPHMFAKESSAQISTLFRTLGLSHIYSELTYQEHYFSYYIQ